MAKKESTAEERERLVAELQSKFARWEQLYADGGFDPFWSDGVNLNLVRNHIRFCMNRIALVFSPAERPALWSRKLPPEVPADYMAHAETYRAFAEERIASGELPLEKAVWYRQLLEKGDLVELRREFWHSQSPEWHEAFVKNNVEIFNEKLRKFKELEPKKRTVTQLSLV